MIKTAMIFAAGLGTRMQPITHNIPKAMVEINGKTMIDYRIDKFLEVGVEKIVINTHYLAPIIEAHLKKRNDIEIITCYEPELLETGGGLVNALPHLGSQPFYITNCDTIWVDTKKQKPILNKMSEQWRNDDMKILMLLHPIETAIGYDGDGDFNLNDDNTISWPSPPRKFVYTGLQIFDPSLLINYQVKPFSLVELWREHIGNKASAKDIFGIINTGHWLHVDSVDNLQTAQEFIKKIDL